MNRFGVFIKNERLRRDMSLRAFADKCGISHTHLDAIEKGVDFRTKKKVSISVETFLKLAKCLNIEPIKLLSLYCENNEDIEPTFSHTATEERLLSMFRKLDPINQGIILAYIEGMLEGIQNKQ